jgi:hypothetical protein
VSVALVVAIALSASASPTGKNCLSEPERKLILDETMLGATNPLGLEHRLRLSMCWPLIEEPGILFDYTALELGVLNYISPTQLHVGAFARLVPLSFLVLRAEGAGFYMWPLPISGTGYIRLPSYTPFTEAAINPPEGAPNQGETAAGARVLLSAALQGELPLSSTWSLIGYDAVSEEYYRVGPGPYFYNIRSDVILHRSDWVTSNNGVLLAGMRLTELVQLRFGPEDELVYVAGSGYWAHLVGGLAALSFGDVGSVVRSVEIFVRAGVYTRHAFREGTPSFALGIDVKYDVFR